MPATHRNEACSAVPSTVHYAAADLADELGRRPTASEVIAAVEE